MTMNGFREDEAGRFDQCRICIWYPISTAR
jgi:hypothetical protein